MPSCSTWGTNCTSNSRFTTAPCRSKSPIPSKPAHWRRSTWCDAMELAWLEFDYSEDAEGNGSFDAMAAASPAQLAALQAEIARVLDWAHANFGNPVPPDEGGEWHFELQGVREIATAMAVDYARGRLQ